MAVPPWADQSRRSDQRGEVFPVTILFGGVMLVVLIGVHVITVSMARTAVQSAAEQGAYAAQSAPDGSPSCGQLGGGLYPTVVLNNQRECEGTLAATAVMNASASMVRMSRLPHVHTDDDAGIVSVVTFGTVVLPVLGVVNVVGRSCGMLEYVAPVAQRGTPPGPADFAAC